MNLQIYLDLSGKIIKIVPSEEFTPYKLGEDFELDGKHYVVTNFSKEEFLDYELIINKIEVADFDEEKYGLH